MVRVAMFFRITEVGKGYGESVLISSLGANNVVTDHTLLAIHHWVIARSGEI